jgi:putative effector of murein hydrolase
MIGQKMIIWYGKPIFCAIVLIAGFLVAQIVCYTVHSYMKEKHHISELLKDDDTFKW